MSRIHVKELLASVACSALLLGLFRPMILGTILASLKNEKVYTKRSHGQLPASARTYVIHNPFGSVYISTSSKPTVSYSLRVQHHTDQGDSRGNAIVESYMTAVTNSRSELHIAVKTPRPATPCDTCTLEIELPHESDIIASTSNGTLYIGAVRNGGDLVIRPARLTYVEAENTTNRGYDEDIIIYSETGNPSYSGNGNYKFEAPSLYANCLSGAVRVQGLVRVRHAKARLGVTVNGLSWSAEASEAMDQQYVGNKSRYYPGR